MSTSYSSFHWQIPLLNLLSKTRHSLTWYPCSIVVLLCGGMSFRSCSLPQWSPANYYLHNQANQDSYLSPSLPQAFARLSCVHAKRALVQASFLWPDSNHFPCFPDHADFCLALACASASLPDLLDFLTSVCPLFLILPCPLSAWLIDIKTL